VIVMKLERLTCRASFFDVLPFVYFPLAAGPISSVTHSRFESSTNVSRTSQFLTLSLRGDVEDERDVEGDRLIPLEVPATSEVVRRKRGSQRR
jgi:hypothetical protein